MQSFEKSSLRLEEILKILSSSDVSLEESLKLYSEAAELIKDCSIILKNAQIKIQEIDNMLSAEVDHE